MKTQQLNRIFITLFLISGLLNLSAQDVILASVADITSPTGMVDYSTNNALNSPSADVAVPEAVQQSLEVYVVGMSQSSELNLTVSAYPNPATNLLMLELGNPILANLSCQLFDTQGEVMHEMSISDNSNMIDMDKLASAIYLLRVAQNTEEIKTYKIIKR